MKILLPSKWTEDLFSYWYKKAFCVLLKNRYDAAFSVTDPKHVILLDRDLEMSLQISHVDDGTPTKKITLVKLAVTVKKDFTLVSTSEFYLADSSDKIPFYHLKAGTDTGFSKEVLRIIEVCIIDSMSYVMKVAGDPDHNSLIVTDWKEVFPEFPKAVELYHLYVAGNDEAKRFSEFLGESFIKQAPMAHCSILDKLGVVNFSSMIDDAKAQYKTIKYPLTADWSEQVYFTLANISGTMFMCSLQNSKEPFVFAEVSINITQSEITCFVRYKQDADRAGIVNDISQFGKVFHRWFTETFEKFVFQLIIKRDPLLEG